jgi:hypothetical protein
MTWPPTQAQREHWKALDFIEGFAPPPKQGPPLDPEAWQRQLALKAEALAFIETFRPWWLTK